ncbi:MAG TPA: PDZ domain-containing protein [Phycisphaerae bacterium]|nr:PDZ domain-containing protein [Phycisphaerae bacterium]
MRCAAFLLTVGMFVVALCSVQARAADIDQELRQLRAENNLLKATLEQRQKEIAELKEEIKALKEEIEHLKTGVTDTAKPTPVTPMPVKDAGAPVLGVTVISADQKVREVFQKDGLARLPITGGVLVSGISMGSPAHTAGLKKLDVIGAIGGKSVADGPSFPSLVSELSVGKPVVLTIYRLSDRKVAGAIPWSRHQITVTPDTMEAVLESAKACPLSLVSARVGYNVIGQPMVSVTVKNIAPEDVVAYSVDIHCWDRFDRPVIHSMLRNDNVFGGISQKTIGPGQTAGGDSEWTLHGHDNTAKVKVVLTKVRLKDGSEWTPGEKEVSITAESNR